MLARIYYKPQRNAHISMIELEEKNNNKRTNERTIENHFNNKWLFNNRWLHLVKLHNKRRNAAHIIHNVHVIHGLLLLFLLLMMLYAPVSFSTLWFQQSWHWKCTCIVFCSYYCQMRTLFVLHIVLQNIWWISIIRFAFDRIACVYHNCIMMHDDEHNKRFGNVRIDLLIE